MQKIIIILIFISLICLVGGSGNKIYKNSNIVGNRKNLWFFGSALFMAVRHGVLSW